jgi:hypothetical protein
LNGGVLDAVQLIPHGFVEQVLVQLPRGARAAVITLVGLTLAALNAQGKIALVITNREQERGPLTRRARRVVTHFGNGCGDGVELRAFVWISAIFDKTRQRIHGGAHPRAVAALSEGQGRETQRKRQGRRHDQSFKQVPHRSFGEPLYSRTRACGKSLLG